MNYAKLYEKRWDDQNTEKSFMDELDKSTQLTWAAIDFFRGRKGFDGWWDGIDEDVQNEIFEDLKEHLSERLLKLP